MKLKMGGQGHIINNNVKYIFDNYKPSDIVKHGRFSPGIYCQVHIRIFIRRNRDLSFPYFDQGNYTVLFLWGKFQIIPYFFTIQSSINRIY